MKKWNNPELLNLNLQETKTEEPRVVINGKCTACGKEGITWDAYKHAWYSGPDYVGYLCQRDSSGDDNGNEDIGTVIPS